MRIRGEGVVSRKTLGIPDDAGPAVFVHPVGYVSKRHLLPREFHGFRSRHAARPMRRR